MIKVMKYGEVPTSEIFSRVVPTINVEEIVAGILADVKENGDKALYAYCEKFDKVKLSALAVSEEEIN
jgi:histidinol dehydrogenase